MATLKELIDSLPEQPTIGCVKQIDKALPNGIGLNKRGRSYYDRDSDTCKQVNITCNLKDQHVSWMALSGYDWKTKLYDKIIKAINDRVIYIEQCKAKKNAEQVRYNIEKERAEHFDKLVAEQPIKLSMLGNPWHHCVNTDMVIHRRLIKQLAVDKVIELYKLVDSFLQTYLHDGD